MSLQNAADVFCSRGLLNLKPTCLTVRYIPYLHTQRRLLESSYVLQCPYKTAHTDDSSKDLYHPSPLTVGLHAQCDPYWNIPRSEWPFKSYVYHIYNPYWHTQRRQWPFRFYMYHIQPILSHLSNLTRSLQNNTYYIHKDKTAFQYNNTLQNRA